MPDTPENILEEAKALLNQVTNVVGILEKNVQSYWNYKDRKKKRSEAELMYELCKNCAGLGFRQAKMAYEIGELDRLSFENDKQRFAEAVAEKICAYMIHIDRLISEIEHNFPAAIESSDRITIGNALLSKKEVCDAMMIMFNKEDFDWDVMHKNVEDIVGILNTFSHESYRLADIFNRYAVM